MLLIEVADVALVLVVKDNQPKLHEAIQQVFRDKGQADLLNLPHWAYETTDTGPTRRRLIPARPQRLAGRQLKTGN
jgi:hypothetical protein